MWKGGKECVLLGRTIVKSNMDEKASIMTWIDKDNLTMVSAGVDVERYGDRLTKRLWI